MLNITDAAKGYLSKLLDEAEAPPSTAVRLAVAPNGLTAGLDKERPGDATFDHGGRKVLLLDEKASEVLEAKTLDTHPTADGERLNIS